MIPISSATPMIFLLLLLCGVALYLLLLWGVLLLCSKTMRAMLRRYWLPSMMLLVVLLPLSWVFVVAALDMYRSNREWDADEKARNPTLAEPTTLAGIQMPAGTKLELPRHSSVGEDWVKPDYFEKAQFPEPVEWQGVPIVRMERNLRKHHDNTHATIGMTWGAYLETELAEPREIDGLHCAADTVVWELLNENSDSKWPDADAAAPAPAGFRMVSCRSSGQTVRSANGALELKLPEYGEIGRNIPRDSDPGQKLEAVWSYAAGSDSRPIVTNLFTLKPHNVYLHMGSLQLYQIRGSIVQGTESCPLLPDTEILWNHARGDKLSTIAASAPIRCGDLKVENVVPDGLR